MLHILLLILKIIGIILAAILGILVLLLCIVLFVPLQYKGRAKSDGTVDGIKADLTCTWLLHLIRFRLFFEEKEAGYRIRILWKKFSSAKDGGKAETPEQGQPEKEFMTDEPNKIKGEGAHEDENRKLEEKQDEADEGGREGNKSDPKETEEESGLSERTPKEYKETEKIDTEETEDEENGGRLTAFIEKCKASLHKIKCTFTRICDKIKALSGKKDQIMDFLQGEIHRTAFAKVKKEAVRLLKRLKPKRLEGEVRFGLEDPCSTGQVLAAYSVFYPFVGEHMKVRPDFEQKVFCADLLLKGKIRVCYFAVLALKLLLSRAVRTTYKDIKRFEF